MRVPDEMRKCVVFLGFEANEVRRLCGTAFILARSLGDTGVNACYIITTQHALDRIRAKSGYRTYLRMNKVGGGTFEIDIELDQWISHPDDANCDAVAFPFDLRPDIDHLGFPVETIVTEEVLSGKGIGVGDEVFMTGLFSQHYGAERNIPIIRVGNIASMPEEPLLSDNRTMDAYLIEARSIGGLSGSPVFVNAGLWRVVDNQPRLHQGPLLYLLGIIHGHWNNPHTAMELDGCRFFDGDQQVNMGIAIVVPARKILEILNQPCFLQAEQRSKTVIVQSQSIVSVDTSNFGPADQDQSIE